MNDKNLAVVIPTFNEAENIGELIRYIKSIHKNSTIIIVDDNSPDKTSELVKDLQNKIDRLHLITRVSERGRGSAVIEGFKRALKSGAEVIVEMDADFSHHPEEIELLIQQLDNSDMVIGSRYLASSRIINWSWQRKLFSRIANLYARALLGIPVADYTNGFRAFRRRTLTELDFNRINLSGYIVLSEIALQVFNKGLRISEVPTIFVNRSRGESNLSIKEVWSAFKGIFKLWWRNNWKNA